MDAALATAFTALATEPGMVSFGGGAYVSVWPSDGDPVVVDGNVEMPGRGADPARFGRGVREVRTDYGGGVTMMAGHGSVATPGIIPAFAVAAERFAALPWARLVEPAAAAARAYPMGRAASRYLAFVADTLFADDAEARSLVTGEDGAQLSGGEERSNDALADTLDRLAAEGPELFSTGDVGRALAATMAEHDGLVTAGDLAAYEPVVRPAHLTRAGSWTVAVNPPPAVGGPMLAVMLGELARRGDWTWDDVIEIQRAVLSYRTSVHDFSRDLEADGTDLLAQVGEHGLSALRGSSSTANVSAVDSDGNACTITMSSGYSAGLVIPGTGILLNNALGEVELNRLGVHALEPGTRLASNMAPTTARSEPGRVLAIGSPGADRITTALMLVLGQGCLHDRDLQAAIAAPRIHLRQVEDGFVVEHEADEAIAAAVARSGLPSHEYAEPHMYFGGVGAAAVSPSGDLQAAGDARREAATGDLRRDATRYSTTTLTRRCPVTTRWAGAVFLTFSMEPISVKKLSLPSSWSLRTKVRSSFFIPVIVVGMSPDLEREREAGVEGQPAALTSGLRRDPVGQGHGLGAARVPQDHSQAELLARLDPGGGLLVELDPSPGEALLDAQQPEDRRVVGHGGDAGHRVDRDVRDEPERPHQVGEVPLGDPRDVDRVGVAVAAAQREGHRAVVPGDRPALHLGTGREGVEHSQVVDDEREVGRLGQGVLDRHHALARAEGGPVADHGPDDGTAGQRRPAARRPRGCGPG